MRQQPMNRINSGRQGRNGPGRIRLRGFSLVEMLTVLAITAILMTLIVLPVFQSFNLTRNAQAFVEAQSRARILTERISKEISEATLIRGTGSPQISRLNGSVNITLPGNSLVVPVADSNAPFEVALRNCKIDLVPPAQGNAQRVNGAYVNPNTGFADPTLAVPKGDVSLPLAPGRTIVRWWLGLRDPASPYNNPYDDLLMRKNGGRDNLVVIHRAEVEPYVYRAGTGINGDRTIAWRPNTEFFESDPQTDTRLIGLDDPRFFIADGLNQAGVTDPAKNTRVANWLRRSRIQTDTSRTDMIQVVYNPATRQVQRDLGLPVIMPLLQFRFTAAAEEQAENLAALRPGEGAVNARLIGPDSFQTRLGHWGTVAIRHIVAGGSLSDADNIASGFGGEVQVQSRRTAGAPVTVFDTSVYRNGLSGPYPFTAAALANGSAWLGTASVRATYTPFWLDSRAGRIVTSFGIEEVGTTPLTGVARPNLPLIPTGDPLANLATTPYGPTDASGNVLTGYSINGAFNRAQTENPSWRGQLHRFAFLPVVPNEDGTLPPSFPYPLAGSVTGFPGNGISSRVRIVPNSETVFGPNQIPGPEYGQPVRYTRTNRDPRINQYRINYVDQPEPNYSALGLPSATAVPYDPTSFQSAVIQPRFRAGYIQFNSDPNVPLPNTVPIRVAYRFQFTGSNPTLVGAAGDTFLVDYDSRQQVDVLLTVRNYAQSTAPNPQSITLKASATLRNPVR